MQVLGILVRTKYDKVTELGFSSAEKVIAIARKRGHMLIDIAESAATRENLVRILDGLGTPAGHFLKIVIFYSHGNPQSPIDQEKKEFITDDVLVKFKGWGVYCMGSGVGQALGHRLLLAGATFVIAFSSKTYIPLKRPSDFFDNWNAGIISMLKEEASPFQATGLMHALFRATIEKLKSGNFDEQIIGTLLSSTVESLSYSGHDFI
jgi:hypothetical protein